jgi:hypothetical protein
VALMSVVLLNKKRFIKILQISVNGKIIVIGNRKLQVNLVQQQANVQNIQQLNLSALIVIVAKQPSLNQM